jgi:hypothetical protein
MQLSTGQIIKAPFLTSAAEIKKFELRSGNDLLEVVLHDRCQIYKPLCITLDEFFLSMQPQKYDLSFHPTQEYDHTDGAFSCHTL